MVLSASELASLRSHSKQVYVTVGGSAAIGNDVLKQFDLPTAAGAPG